MGSHCRNQTSTSLLAFFDFIDVVINCIYVYQFHCLESAHKLVYMYLVPCHRCHRQFWALTVDTDSLPRSQR